MRYLLAISVFLICVVNETEAQFQCGSGTPTFNVNLSNDPNAFWQSPDTVRNDTCCGSIAPDKCVGFEVLLHPLAEGIIFEICDGAIPPGAIFYEVNCSGPTPVGEALCLSGPGPHYITFCKPGNNQNKYCITSIAEPAPGPDISVNDGCNGQLYVAGYDPTTLQWNSVYPGGIGAYNNYLDCTTGCDTVNVSGQANAPDTVLYEVCGSLFGDCDTAYYCDTITAYFFSTLQAIISPEWPTVCYGSAGTYIYAEGAGGSPPYNFEWSTGSTADSIYVGVGTYTLQISDISGCPPAYDTVIVTEFSLPIEANAGLDTTYCENSLPFQLNGSVQAAVGGVWSAGDGLFLPDSTVLNANYQPGPLDSLLGFVSFVLTTTGNGSCPPDADTVQMDIHRYDSPVIFSVQNVTCNGLSDGAIYVQSQSGMSISTYEWGTTPVQNGDSISGLSAGTYDVTITDSLGCDSIASIVVSEPLELDISIDTFGHASCITYDDGWAQSIANGGTSPYTFLWSTNASGAQLTNVPAGSYTATVTDSNGCMDSTLVSINEPPGITIASNVVDVDCYGENTGAISATASGPYSGFQYNWSTGGNNSIVFNLVAGTYTLTVTYGNNCLDSDSIIVQQPDLLSLVLLGQNISCFGANDGEVQSAVAGGVAPYSYLWSNGAINDQVGGLSAGNILVTVTDDNGCEIFDSTFISEPLEVVILDSINDLTCFESNDGSIYTTVSGGVAPIQYAWSTGGMFDSISGLPVGTYTITVTDSTGCQEISTMLVTEPEPLVISLDSVINASCPNYQDGSIFLNALGGTLPYNFIWNSNTSGPVASALGIGNYSVTLTDSNACMDTASFQIEEPDTIDIQFNLDHVDCYDGTTGTAVAIAVGQYNNFQYNWSNGSTQDTTINLEAGVYTVTVTFGNNCLDSAQIQITQPDTLDVSLVINDISCYGFNDGSISAAASGGVGPYDYFWSNATIGSQTSGLSPGSYTVTVSDDNNCISLISGMVVEPQQLEASGVISDVSCFGGTDASIFASASGGIAPYSYQWSTGGSSALITGLPIGIYVVTATDSNSCVDTAIFTVTQPSALDMIFSGDDATCHGGSDGWLSVFPSGGTPGYSYVWSSTTTNDTAVGLSAGMHSVTVTDANGCTMVRDSSITHPPAIQIQMSQNATICLNSSTGIFVTSNGGNGGYQYSWNNGLGNAAFHLVSPTITTTYTVTVTDTFACPPAIGSVKVSVKPVVFDSISVTSNPFEICEGNSVDIIGQYFGPLSNYTVIWEPAFGTTPGIYTVEPEETSQYKMRVIDDCGFETADSVVVIVNPTPVMDIPQIIDEGCVPFHVSFSSGITGVNIAYYEWNFGNGLSSNDAYPSTVYAIPGTFQVELSAISDKDCKAVGNGDGQIIARPTPSASFTTYPDRLTTNQPTMSAEETTTNAVAFDWQISDGAAYDGALIEHTFADWGNYDIQLVVKNIFGCLDTAFKSVYVEPITLLEAPTAFTPNRNASVDGHFDPNEMNNDIFYLITEYVDEFHLVVYNRWGETVFESFDPYFGWNGYYKGELAPMAMYVWRADVKYVDGKNETVTGNITLLR